MKLIVSKREVENFITTFEEKASYDSAGNKHYFILEDNERDGIWTLIRYKDSGAWTIHGKGETYCDDHEQELTEKELYAFLYKNRKYINNELRKQREESLVGTN